ncbi:MAG: NAD-dependent epimerase/dehydratase family protein [Thermoplasmata archaeon]|nr:NAD-dependent epimerase/dehydratase family protein [Thermoplasmata archaeon]
MFDSLVTGSAGFVGSHLVEALLERGDRVLGVDSFDPYYSSAQKRRNLRRSLHNHRYRFVRGRIQGVNVARYVSKGAVIYHLAAQPGVRGSWGTKFDRYVQNNVLATQALLESAVRSGVRPKVVYASSSSIYGDQPTGPMPEEANPNPVSPYGMTKLAAEHLGRLYARAYGLPFVSTRLFTVYGPRQRPDMAFHRFFRAVRSGRPIEVFGDGRQLRDFTYVGDIVDGIVRAGASDSKHTVFNLGGNSPVPLTDAISYIREVTGRPVKITRRAPQTGDPRATWADNRRARSELKFRPRTPLLEGLRRQWAWQSGEAGGDLVG